MFTHEKSSTGFGHTSYTFQKEAHLEDSKNYNVQIPRGQIVTLLTRALAYTEVQHHWKKARFEINIDWFRRLTSTR